MDSWVLGEYWSLRIQAQRVIVLLNGCSYPQRSVLYNELTHELLDMQRLYIHAMPTAVGLMPVTPMHLVETLDQE